MCPAIYIQTCVGHEFELGDNPRVNAQFSIRYCVANALLEKSSSLEHFEENRIRQGKAAEFSKHVQVIPDKAIEQRGHTAMDMRIYMRDGREFFRQTDIAPGFPGNPLIRKDHWKRFQDCFAFSKKPISRENAEEIAFLIENLEDIEDVKIFTQLFIN